MNYFSSAATARNPYNAKIVSRISRGAAGKGDLTDPQQRLASDSVEAELIEKAKLGDAHAFQALYDKHKRRVYSLCLRMTSNTAEAEDLTQEAFLQLYRKIGTFRGESAFSTWLHRLSVNVVLMHLRKKSLPVVSLEETTQPGEDDTPKKDFGAEDMELHPLAAIFGVMAGAEIAGILGIYLSIPVMASLRIVFRRWRLYAEKRKFGPLTAEYSIGTQGVHRK